MVVWVEDIRKNEKDLIFSLHLSQATKYRNSVEQASTNANLEPTSLVRVQGVYEFGWEKNDIFVFTNMKYSISLSYRCAQQPHPYS